MRERAKRGRGVTGSAQGLPRAGWRRKVRPLRVYSSEAVKVPSGFKSPENPRKKLSGPKISSKRLRQEQRLFR